jgi:2-polyprenyl-3-methyl-5-hydroxy-6-metoxy-1,4-benzoquinol methylase
MTDNLRDLNARARQQWDAKASFWDTLHGYEGNQFHQTLVGPSAESLLDIKAGERVLDVACGNGQFSRRLVELGAQVVATDFSAALLDHARSRTTTSQIDYRVVDATDEAELLALGIGSFDAIVCNMALQDIADITPLFRAGRRLIKPGGRFVFTLTHPCFNLGGTVFSQERYEINGEIRYAFALKQTQYLTSAAEESVGAPDEPNGHLYFHRPMHELLNTGFSAGWRMDRMLEPAFPAGTVGGRRLSWTEFQEFPPVLAARFS